VPGCSGTRLWLRVAGFFGTGPNQTTQLFTGRDAWVAMADQEASSALRIVMATPRRQRNWSANGYIRREYTPWFPR